MIDNVTRAIEKIEQAGAAPSLGRIQRGVEKESLRINLDGSLSQADHPQTLGSPLTHPFITTDYSEALLELVSPVCRSIPELLQFLQHVHQFVYQNIGRESLWATSMPCVLHGEDDIPIARYGTSNIGQMKHIYRKGLAYRYGKTMQSIAGIHFNFSLEDAFWHEWREIIHSALPLRDFKSDQYFSLVRNFYRIFWVVLYVFGASPAVCKTFLEGRNHTLQEFGHATFFLPYATSLRMSNIGYQSEVQASIAINLNSLNEYSESLLDATQTPHPAYQKIGVKVGGNYRQLNGNLLQIENEYYAPVRPKRVARSGEKPTTALQQRGVEYIEIRSIDLDPFLPVGIDETGIKFLEVLLLYCLFDYSPPLEQTEEYRLRANRDRIVFNGRQPNLLINTETGEQSVADAGKTLLHRMQPIADLLDEFGQIGYRDALTKQAEKFENLELTPSARILATMRDHDISFFEFAMNQSRKHQDFFQHKTLSDSEEQRFVNEARNSLKCQLALEAADTLSLDHFLDQILSD